MITHRRALGSGPGPTEQTPATRSAGAATAAERSTEVPPENGRPPVSPAPGRRPLRAGPEQADS